MSLSAGIAALESSDKVEPILLALTLAQAEPAIHTHWQNLEKNGRFPLRLSIFAFPRTTRPLAIANALRLLLEKDPGHVDWYRSEYSGSMSFMRLLIYWEARIFQDRERFKQDIPPFFAALRAAHAGEMPRVFNDLFVHHLPTGASGAETRLWFVIFPRSGRVYVLDFSGPAEFSRQS